jgi:hypothetical protein
MRKYDEAIAAEIESIYDKALNDVIENYIAYGDIGYSHMVGGWICRELKKRGHLSVTQEREKYLFVDAKRGLRKRFEFTRINYSSGCIDGFALSYAGCSRKCDVCDKSDCKILANYRDMLVLYDWLNENYGNDRNMTKRRFN